ncbi:hypothetical protein GIB67_027139 [Kingdonia uniflora]|uniref:Phosphoribulokinase/uridine kinase domain-containing protein n=1 Tax=Kingdonia uniflora TaxID=39325 RepID=A0A7J7P2P8_9MAGN|nr:hypothetical protein GIB67_027139 [Kingdonia uniflora]
MCVCFVFVTLSLSTMEFLTFRKITGAIWSIKSSSLESSSSSSSSLLNKCTRHQLSLSVSPTSRPRLATRKLNRFKVLSTSGDKETNVLEAKCIEEIYDALAERLLPVAATTSNLDSKYIVGLAGSPGAGKSTVASEVARRINMLWPQKAPAMDSLVEPFDIAVVLPMDGFHLYRHQLDAMENPEEAHARRGAPWTFDPARLLTFLKTLRSQGSVYVPSFNHGVGDPVEDDIFVSLQHKVVIVEGNYLLLEEGIWKEVSSVFNEKWFIEVDIDKAMERVLKRHISTGKYNQSPIFSFGLKRNICTPSSAIFQCGIICAQPRKPPDVAKWRIKYNDRPNAELINESKINADLVIRFMEVDASYLDLA